eukprot:1365499-Amorphochlora_amoeboformis.AAC.1
MSWMLVERLSSTHRAIWNVNQESRRLQSSLKLAECVQQDHPKEEGHWCFEHQMAGQESPELRGEE